LRFADRERALREFVLVDALLVPADFLAVVLFFFAPLDFIAPERFLVALRFRVGVLRPGRRIPVADSSRDSRLSTWLASRSIAVRRSFISSPVICRRSCSASRTRSLTPAAAPLVRSARVTTSSTTSCARSRVSPADPTVVWTVRSTARRTASTPVCFDVDFDAVDLRAAGLRAGDLRAVDFRAVDLRAVDLRAVDFRAVDLRAVDLRAVDLRAVDFRAVDFRADAFAELERRAVGMPAT
jgi:Pentapeptide repeats (9 copies)